MTKPKEKIENIISCIYLRREIFCETAGVWFPPRCQTLMSVWRMPVTGGGSWIDKRPLCHHFASAERSGPGKRPGSYRPGAQRISELLDYEYDGVWSMLLASRQTFH